MAHSALVISKEELELDSRFAWTAKLSTSDYSSEKVIVIHDSLDDEVTLLEELAKLYRVNSDRKFIYINNSPSPMLTAYIFGIGGITLEDEFPLSDGELLNDIILDYQDCDFKMKTPTEEFGDLAKAMERITSGKLDEDELHEILTSPDWLRQVRSSIKAVSTTLVRVDTSHKELAVYIDHSRDLLTKLRSDIVSARSKLENALLAVNTAQTQQAEGSSKNKVTTFPAVKVPLGTGTVLYIRELSPCSHLTSMMMAYAYYLNKMKYMKCKLLVVQQGDLAQDRYSSDVFYTLSSISIGHAIPDDKTYFYTWEPTLQIMHSFFNLKASYYIVIDRLTQKSDLLLPSQSVKRLYASDSRALLSNLGVKMSNTISSCRPAKDEGINIPFLVDYRAATSEPHRVQKYWQPVQKGEAKYFNQLDSILGIT